MSLQMKAQSSSDYESIPSFDPNNRNGPRTAATLEPVRKPPMLVHLKTTRANSSSDYESIPSFDMGIERYNAADGKSRVPMAHPSSECSASSNNSSHDYETIDCFATTQSIDLDSPDSPPFIPDGAARNKFLKVDSQGYASVLYPHEEDETESWEFDCLNQEKYRNESTSSTSSVTVKNVEEAWRHQLVKGYAPLTLQRQPPPPIFNRTRSAPTVPTVPAVPTAVPTASSVQQEPQDYEVPLHLMAGAIPPPPHVAMKRNSLTKQPAQDLRTPAEEAAKVLTDVPEDDSEDEEKSEMRSRVMTAPSTSFQTFKTD